ncbi:MAG: insulinase family protein [Rhodospirillales bacterium]|nr:insulinase family protein [Rhodospirillales bacterium]
MNDVRNGIERELARLAAEGPTEREVQQAMNAIEANFLNRLEFVSAKADQLNNYYFLTGQPDGFQADLDRYRSVTAEDVKRVVQRYLTDWPDHAVIKTIGLRLGSLSLLMIAIFSAVRIRNAPKMRITAWYWHQRRPHCDEDRAKDQRPE